ncbi:hypothetical protein Goe16_02270 [Bacillus phage vB_BsuM-Goe16]|nr:hypothetical protein Goe16_00330 [Bacillus phage vB_BsuM-Goe16]WCS68641.1 hypothetical protein Goe16_02270 [Bacillus phage vB_BsuM-Goe16]
MTLFIAGVTLEEIQEVTVSALKIKLEHEKKALYLGAGSQSKLDACKCIMRKVQEDNAPLDTGEKKYLRSLLQDYVSGQFLGGDFVNEVRHCPEDLRRTVTTAFTYTVAIRHYCV